MDASRALSADTAALVAAKLTACVVQLETSDVTESISDARGFVLGVFQGFLGELMLGDGTAAELRTIISPDP